MTVKPLNKLSGVYTVPGDKSITHRALILNALAEGSATLRGAYTGAEIIATAAGMEALGVKIVFDGAVVRIKGKPKIKSGAVLDFGCSGTALRLMAGYLCGAGVSAKLSCARKQSKLERIEQPLADMGARLVRKDGAPAEIKPAHLRGIEYTLPGGAAQTKGALLLAGLNAEGATVLHEPAPSRNHTELMLAAMSADIKFSRGRIEIKKSNAGLKSIDVDIPGDLSAAANLIVMATVLQGSGIVIKNVGINRTRRAAIDIINSSGGNITLLNKRKFGEEPAADLFVQSAWLLPFNVGGAAAADEVPALAVLACFCDGTSVFRNMAHLKERENNRLRLTVNMLKAMGANVRETEDGMVIRGGGVLTGGCKIDAEGDRVVTAAAAVAAAVSVDGAEIENPAESAFIFYPAEINSTRKTAKD
ncbi:MAG: 3-phosphoshikimate 1-carboxyvinyltransferase [Firmicutes bacterium]|nr:3-phosphoshikimate 1-carboxyvinyltransferase [Bacillota bacterium]